MAVTGKEPISAENLRAVLSSDGAGGIYATDEELQEYLNGIEVAVTTPIDGATVRDFGSKCTAETTRLYFRVDDTRIYGYSGQTIAVVPERFCPDGDLEVSLKVSSGGTSWTKTGLLSGGLLTITGYSGTVEGVTLDVSYPTGDGVFGRTAEKIMTARQFRLFTQGE